MTENEIEDIVSKKIDRIDILFLAGAITKRQYNEVYKQIERWAEAKYAEARKGVKA